jgi:hypothetical protein
VPGFAQHAHLLTFQLHGLLRSLCNGEVPFGLSERLLGDIDVRFAGLQVHLGLIERGDTAWSDSSGPASLAPPHRDSLPDCSMGRSTAR